jgi:hypothetical protein
MVLFASSVITRSLKTFPSMECVNIFNMISTKYTISIYMEMYARIPSSREPHITSSAFRSESVLLLLFAIV